MTVDIQQIAKYLHTSVAAPDEVTLEIPATRLPVADPRGFFHSALGQPADVVTNLLPQDLFRDARLTGFVQASLESGALEFSLTLEWETTWTIVPDHVSVDYPSITFQVSDGHASADFSTEISVGELDLVLEFELPLRQGKAYLKPGTTAHLQPVLKSLDVNEDCFAQAELTEVLLLVDERAKNFSLQLDLAHALSLGPFSVEDVFLELYYVHGGTEHFRGSIASRIQLDLGNGVDIALRGEYGGREQGWTFSGQVEFGDNSPAIQDVANFLTRKFEIPESDAIPEFVPRVELESFGFSINTRGHYSMDVRTNDFSLSIEVDKLDNGKYEHTAHLSLEIGSEVIDVRDKREQYARMSTGIDPRVGQEVDSFLPVDVLSGDWHATGNETLHLSDLANSFEEKLSGDLISNWFAGNPPFSTPLSLPQPNPFNTAFPQIGLPSSWSDIGDGALSKLESRFKEILDVKELCLEVTHSKQAGWSPIKVGALWQHAAVYLQIDHLGGKQAKLYLLAFNLQNSAADSSDLASMIPGVDLTALSEVTFVVIHTPKNAQSSQLGAQWGPLRSRVRLAPPGPLSKKAPFGGLEDMDLTLQRGIYVLGAITPNDAERRIQSLLNEIVNDFTGCDPNITLPSLGDEKLLWEIGLGSPLTNSLFRLAYPKSISFELPFDGGSITISQPFIQLQRKPALMFSVQGKISWHLYDTFEVTVGGSVELDQQQGQSHVRAEIRGKVALFAQTARQAATRRPMSLIQTFPGVHFWEVDFLIGFDDSDVMVGLGGKAFIAEFDKQIYSHPGSAHFSVFAILRMKGEEIPDPIFFQCQLWNFHITDIFLALTGVKLSQGNAAVQALYNFFELKYASLYYADESNIQLPDGSLTKKGVGFTGYVELFGSYEVFAHFSYISKPNSGMPTGFDVKKGAFVAEVWMSELKLLGGNLLDISDVDGKNPGKQVRAFDSIQHQYKDDHGGYTPQLKDKKKVQAQPEGKPKLTGKTTDFKGGPYLYIDTTKETAIARAKAKFLNSFEADVDLEIRLKQEDFSFHMDIAVDGFDGGDVRDNLGPFGFLVPDVDLKVHFGGGFSLKRSGSDVQITVELDIGKVELGDWVVNPSDAGTLALTIHVGYDLDKLVSDTFDLVKDKLEDWFEEYLKNLVPWGAARKIINEAKRIVHDLELGFDAATSEASKDWNKASAFFSDIGQAIGDGLGAAERSLDKATHTVEQAADDARDAVSKTWDYITSPFDL